MAEGVIIIGSGGKDVWLNASARRLLGFDAGDAFAYDRLEGKLREVGLLQSKEYLEIIKENAARINRIVDRCSTSQISNPGRWSQSKQGKGSKFIITTRGRT